MPFLAASLAALTGISIVTTQLIFGTTSKVYDAPEPEKFDAKAFDKIMSSIVNPVTVSENVSTTGIGDTLVVAGAVLVIEAVGIVPSNVNEIVSEGWFFLPEGVCATSFAIETFTTPSADGITSNVYAAPEP